MPESKQWRNCEIETIRTSSYGQAIPITSDPAHLSTLAAPTITTKRRLEDKSLCECRPTSDETDNAGHKQPEEQAVYGDNEPQRVMVIVYPALHRVRLAGHSKPLRQAEHDCDKSLFHSLTIRPESFGRYPFLLNQSSIEAFSSSRGTRSPISI